jgi:hypothetical protein
MNFEMSRHFEKLVLKIKDKTIKTRLKKIIEKVAQAQSLDEISNIIPNCWTS